jgi:hypothetical protein
VRAFIFGAVLLLAAAGAYATPTTHIWAPSTDIQPFNLWHIGADMYIPVQRDASGSRVATVNNLGLTVGVIPGRTLGAEVGFDYRSGLGTADDYPLYLNAKVGLPEDAFGKGMPSLAAGFYDLGTKSDVTNFGIIYAKIARTIPAGKSNLGRLSLGYFTGNRKLLVDDKLAADNSGVLAAWERTMTEISDKLWLSLEYMGTKSLYGSFNVGGSWKVASNTAVLIGYEIYNNSAYVNTATFQLDIDL